MIDQQDEKIPKNIELVNVLSSFLESSIESGEIRGMTKLAKEISLKSGKPHVDTVRNKLTEGFIMRDILNDYKPTYEEGKLIRIQKVESKNVNMERVLDILIKIKEEQAEIRKEIRKK